MNDKQLLERAARAAGIRLDWWEWPKALRAIPGPSTDEPDEFDCVYWNPLQSDADAFRLMMAMGLSVECFRNCIIVTVDGSETREVYRRNLDTEWHEDEARSATRRAIVRAAAAMAE